ncbi:3029_t:CDS:1, partial [Funneliformis geosporum]
KNDNITNGNIQTVSYWQSIVLRWINVLENDLDLEESEDASIYYENDEDDISLSNIFNLPHPVIDKNAKWKLQDIFIEDLEPTNYLEIFINNN